MTGVTARWEELVSASHEAGNGGSEFASELADQFAELRARMRTDGLPAQSYGASGGASGKRLAVAAAAVAALAVAGAFALSGDDPRATAAKTTAPAAAKPSTDVAAPVKPAAAVPEAAKPAAPDLAAAAAELAAATAPGEKLGRVVLPRVVYRHDLVQGAALPDLERHAGHYATSVLPGQKGVVGVAARLVKSGPAYGPLAGVRAGDSVMLEMPYGDFTYRVGSVREVPLRDTSALHASASRLVVTVAGASKRLVISAAPVRHRVH